MLNNYMIDEYLQLLGFVLAFIAVVGFAAIGVGIMYLIEEGVNDCANWIFELFENNNGGVEL